MVSTRGGSDEETGGNTKPKRSAGGGTALARYFVIVVLGFLAVTALVNRQFSRSMQFLEANNSNGAGSALKEFEAHHHQKQAVAQALEQLPDLGNDDDEDKGAMDDDGEKEDANQAGDDDEATEATKDPMNGEAAEDDDEEEEEEEGEEEDDGGDLNPGKTDDHATDDHLKKHPHQFQHTIANLDCSAYGGPSTEEAEEMVYWEDIPEDAKHMSPFHREHPQNRNGDVQSVTQFMTFEPDGGGWNNIRMAMETVLTLAFATGRTLVLPPHQGMYLIDKGGDKQKNKFSFDHFFHMESISAEHIGLNIITNKEFMELCVQGKVLDKDGKPIYPPGMRTEWDGAPHNELRELKMWLRESSGQSLAHWDPDRCIAAFPSTNSVEDYEALKALPAEIAKQEEGFPPYEKYIGKPHDVDAPAIERLKEMHADRTELCLYTPELQQTQWIHFPVGVKTKTPSGNHFDESRLLVHFYCFLFFQDWKQDLWMKRFVRDHVRYIDEIQCAAARVVAALRKRVAARTNGKTRDFDTVHVRRGDFQFKETRVSAEKILEQLVKKMEKDTTLYIATDERDKSFFQPIQDHFADVVFLDDLLAEVEGVNTNYYGMIDQLVASRGKTFFGAWFSTFTGYINRLRGYHADDHETPGYEQGIIPSYYYAMPDRFDHLQRFWPIKKQFYAREFPASWRLIDASAKE